MYSITIVALSASPKDLEAFAAALTSAGFKPDAKNSDIGPATRTVIAYPLGKYYVSYPLWAADLDASVKTLILADAISAAIA